MWNEAETWGIIWDKIEGLLDQVSVKNVLLVWNTTESYTKSTVSVCLQRIKSKSLLIISFVRTSTNQSHRFVTLPNTSLEINASNENTTANTPDPPYPTILTCSHVFQFRLLGF